MAVLRDLFKVNPITAIAVGVGATLLAARCRAGAAAGGENISGYAFGPPAGAAQRHEMLIKPVSTDDLVAAVQRRIGNPTA